MTNQLTVKYNDVPIYDIILEKDFSNFLSVFDTIRKEQGIENGNQPLFLNKKVCIVSDSEVSSHYIKDIIKPLRDHMKEIKTFTFAAGESSKNLDTVYNLYDMLIENNFDRKDILIALGGGVVGDLTGYTAATYLRGISFIQVPTSLLAMVDSSIGGKTGVDFHAYKNMIGAFHQPKAVYINLSTLNSLTDRQFNSGLGEIIKHGLIKDYDYYQWIDANKEAIKSKDLSVLMEMIDRSCAIKRDVVEKDPKELGERALLNFGHTLGHAIEKLMEFKLLHGECVTLGMVAAGFISYQRGGITKEQLIDMERLFDYFNMPIRINGLLAEEILQVASHDKKMESGKLKFILLSRIGNAVIDTTVTRDELIGAIQYILN
ncbi:MAG: 3-dehydroquinate synthase [Lachnospiraceae bacterium]|jgi:3-dehydroquinate synthase|nr:3-dehydroquinate synthase [Lachnospiraceae bacterium]